MRRECKKGWEFLASALLLVESSHWNHSTPISVCFFQCVCWGWKVSSLSKKNNNQEDVEEGRWGVDARNASSHRRMLRDNFICFLVCCTKNGDAHLCCVRIWCANIQCSLIVMKKCVEETRRTENESESRQSELVSKKSSLGKVLAGCGAPPRRLFALIHIEYLSSQSAVCWSRGESFFNFIPTGERCVLQIAV